MSDLANSVVLAGWLTKSPAEKHPWKAKWRERWFVLRQSDHIPGQYLLEYYSNEECKKLKGCINLDELEQVDAGLALKSGSGNKSGKYVFDIHTSKRLYYLATRSEEEMNKWVQSICSVCGLRLREREEPLPSTIDHRYSPVPNGSRSAFGNGPTIYPTASNTGDNNNGRYLEGQFKSQVVSKQPSNSVAIHHQKEASTSSSESSGPYIPISECHSGNPNDVRASDSVTTPTTKDTLKPSSATNSSVNKNVILADELYDFPRANNSVTLKVTDESSTGTSAHGTNDESSNNNWPNFTSSKDDIIRASVRSCSALPDSCKSNSTLTRDSRNSQSFHSASRLRGPSSTSTASAAGEESSVQGNKKYYDNDLTGMSGSETTLLTGKVPPPRPPKPATLRRSKSKSQSSSSLVNNNEVIEDLQQLQQSVPPPPPPVVTVSQVDESYDIPKSTSNKDTMSNVTQVVPTPMSTVYVRGKKAPLNQATSPLTNVPRPPEVVNTSVDLYDFPKSVEANTNSTGTIGSTTGTPSKGEPVFDLNATVPFIGQMKKDSGGRHSYSNAAPGFKSTKESVFNYDYKPTLPTTSDDQITLSPFGDSSHQATVDKSPRTPNSVFSPSSDVTPPAVDRKLKPKPRKDSDPTASPTVPNPFPLSPPPAVSRKSNFSTSTLPSSKSLKNKNGQHSYDSIPRLSNTLGHRASSTGCHSRDPSISEDDSHVTGRTGEEVNKVKLPRKQRKIPENPELQYLDLDLIESDHSSPRTPTSVAIAAAAAAASEPINHPSSVSSIKHATVVTSHKERSPGGTNVAATITPSLAKSTVYKTVDFIKTEALNKLRHTLDQGNT